MSVNKKLYSSTGLILLGVAFLVFTLLNNTLFSNIRLDLTENNLYTLSDGTREVIESIEEPINLYFYFSEGASEDLTSLRSYAVRVKELLEEYAAVSAGEIKLNIIDPEPFSDDEDRAAAFGLQAVPVSAAGDSLYFGLAGTNALDDLVIIPFFQPDKEEFLEYEISKLVQSLILTEKPVIGLISSLQVQGDVNMTTFQSTPAWMVMQQLEELFTVTDVDAESEMVPADVDILMVIHPKQLSEQMLFSIDQFLMNGGKMLAFVDPLAETDKPAQANPMMPSAPTNQSSNLNELTRGWGVTLRDNFVLGDSERALSVSGSNGAPVRHVAIVGMVGENFEKQDIVTAELESINLATAGILDLATKTTVEVQPLITSSTLAMPLDSFQFQFLRDPADLQKDFAATGEKYLLAARFSGKANSAYPDGIDGFEGDLVAATDQLNVILVADTDMLSDRLWVQVQNFFGQKIASPFANNGDFVVNALDNLGGSTALISVRSRGRFSRPFDVVQELRRVADERYLESADELQAQLNETESKLSELQSATQGAGLLTLSPEQEAAVVQFQQEKLRIRKQLRDVRHQLDQDIDALGSTLKFLNIALIPLLLTLLLIVMRYLRTRSEEVA